MRDIITGILVATAIAGLFVCAVSCSDPKPNQSRHMSDTMTMIRHGTTNTFIITPDRHDDAIHELRQNIADLQNRVYELENE